MANLTPTPEWLGVPQLETSDYAEGGPEGKANEQAQAILNMLQWLIVRGLGTAYDANVIYAPGALTMKDDALQIFDGENWTKIEADHKSLKKASNLSDLVDAVAARANLSVYSKEETDTLRNQVPLGVTMHWTGARSAIPDGWLAYDGLTYNRVDYPELWAMIESGALPSVSDATWLASNAQRGKYSTGNGSTTFRTPDLNGIQSGSLKSPVLRGDGYAPAGGMVGDAIRDIQGSFRTASEQSYSRLLTKTGMLGAFEVLGGVDESSYKNLNIDAATTQTQNDRTSGAQFRASLVVPTADENRPNSAFYVVIGKVRGVTNPDLADHAPATTGANRFDGSQTIFGNLEVSGEYVGNLTKNVKAALGAEGSLPILPVRAWCKFSGYGTVWIKRSAGVLSLTDLGVGQYRVNLIADMPHIEMATIATASDDNIFSSDGRAAANSASISAVNVGTRNGSGAFSDFSAISFALIG